MVLPRHDDLRVELVEERGLPGQALLEPRPERVVVRARVGPAVAARDAPRVGVHDEDRMPPRVEEDAVRGLAVEHPECELSDRAHLACLILQAAANEPMIHRRIHP